MAVDTTNDSIYTMRLDFGSDSPTLFQVSGLPRDSAASGRLNCPSVVAVFSSPSPPDTLHMQPVGTFEMRWVGPNPPWWSYMVGGFDTLVVRR